MLNPDRGAARDVRRPGREAGTQAREGEPMHAVPMGGVDEVGLDHQVLVDER